MLTQKREGEQMKYYIKFSFDRGISNHYNQEEVEIKGPDPLLDVLKNEENLDKIRIVFIDNKNKAIRFFGSPKKKSDNEYRISLVAYSKNQFVYKYIGDVLNVDIDKLKKGDGEKKYVRSVTSDFYHNIFSLYFQNGNISGENKSRISELGRSDESRDRDRIMYSKSFRRLADKAQIFSARQGVHYRNRMSHTLEVSNIAKTIAERLNKEKNQTINVDLCEAIALGHDVGHTPFGHTGERKIQEWLSEKFEYLEQDYKYFKHNLQSARVLDVLEDCYSEHRGLQVDQKVLVGVLAHTKLPKIGDFDSTLDFIKKYYISNTTGIEDVINFKKSAREKGIVTNYIEAAIVKQADEIAQRCHDIDDGLASDIINIDGFISYLEMFTTCEYSQKLLEIIQKVKDEAEEFVIFDPTNIYRSRLGSQVIKIFVNSIISEFKEGSLSVDFSSEVKEFRDNMNKYVKVQLIGSPKVSKYDQKGAKIILDLLETYFNNYKLLPLSVRRKMTFEMAEFYFKQGKKEKDIIPLEFATDTVNDFVQLLITGQKSIKKGDGLFKISEAFNENMEFIKECRSIFVQGIVDYVAGMSDEYAKKIYADFHEIN